MINSSVVCGDNMCTVSFALIYLSNLEQVVHLTSHEKTRIFILHLRQLHISSPQLVSTIGSMNWFSTHYIQHPFRTTFIHIYINLIKASIYLGKTVKCLHPFSVDWKAIHFLSLTPRTPYSFTWPNINGLLSAWYVQHWCRNPFIWSLSIQLRPSANLE